MNNVLERYASSVTSQDGEDGILEHIFERLGVGKGFCIEFGAADGHYLSNTFRLIHHCGWSSVAN